MARKPLCTVERVNAYIDLMIMDCKEQDIVPTDFRLMELAGVSSRTLDRWYSGDQDKEADEDEAGHKSYKDAMNRLIQFRSQLCVDKMAASPKTAANWIFLSKQKRWGGFQDVQKMESNGTQKLEISIKGADGNPLKHGRDKA